jgi:hypothetical protein
MFREHDGTEDKLRSGPDMAFFSDLDGTIRPEILRSSPNKRSSLKHRAIAHKSESEDEGVMGTFPPTRAAGSDAPNVRPSKAIAFLSQHCPKAGYSGRYRYGDRMILGWLF